MRLICDKIYNNRESLKLVKRFFLLYLCLVPFVAGANVATTAGSNLTAWNGDSGATNNNNWNQLMNPRGQASGPVGVKPKADFGNCNSLILRCAQPKCAGCTTMDVARSIVAGCVSSNDTCKKHGDDLVDFISAQIVAEANAQLQQQQIAAQNAAAQAAAAQNSAQMQQMQQQMQQMQYEMQQQNAQQMQQMQAALDEQRAIAAAAQADAVAAAQANVANQMAAAVSAQDNMGLSAAQVEAAEKGVDADVLVRQQISGQIMSKIENAEVALKTLRDTMRDTFTYAGCDTRGNNCSGPKRVKMFKQKAMRFFDPYNDVLDELYDALIVAQSVGVDITDIYMMLNGSCNVWGEYLCTDTTRTVYNKDNCSNGKSVAGVDTNGGHSCVEKQVVPAEDSPACVLQRTLSSADEVQRAWLDSAEGTYDSTIRIGCASAALESSGLFANRKKQASIDIETLERIIEQDAPASLGGRFNQSTDVKDLYKYCAVASEGAYLELQKAVSLQKLPKTICVDDKYLTNATVEGWTPQTQNEAANAIVANCSNKATNLEKMKCLCESAGMTVWNEQKRECECLATGWEGAKKFNWDKLICQTEGEYKEGAPNQNKPLDFKNFNLCGLFAESKNGQCYCDGRMFDYGTHKCSMVVSGKKEVVTK